MKPVAKKNAKFPDTFCDPAALCTEQGENEVPDRITN
jgi:hypothetical protein